MAGRALRDLSWRFAVWRKYWRGYKWRVYELFSKCARPAYCCMCGCWSWSTWERAPYSSGCGYLCEDCAEENDRGLEAERRDVYGCY
jgi:hypothetical protein